MVIVIIMGIHQLSAVHHYWSTDSILAVPAVSNVMTCERFKAVIGEIHLNFNKTMLPKDDPHYDKLHNIRPLVDDLN